jgi:Common central domain of tyrosinase/von Willebrand factor type A domain
MRCRRNYRDLGDAERQDLIDAFLALKANGTIDQFADWHEAHFSIAHNSSMIWPWHREFIRLFENELRAAKPGVTIPYWNWTAAEDRSPGALLWSPQWLGAFDGWGLGRTVGAAGSLPTIEDVNADLATTSYLAFRPALEGDHNPVHPWVGGQMGGARSPEDPVFFFHHCFMDLIWAYWQRLNPGVIYEPVSADDPAFDEAMMPFTATPGDVEDHRAINEYDYPDDWGQDPPLVTLETASLTFQDVPEGETTMRAVVFDLRSCSLVHFEITDGPSVTGGGPNPFGTLAGPTVTANPLADPKGRVWFSYTATNDGDVAAGSVTVRCQETGDEWTIPITANTVARPMAAVVVALDRSNSMNFDSGVGPGITRGEVLQFSAPPFTTVIDESNALGIVAFDQDTADLLSVTVADGAGKLQMAGALAGYAPNPEGWTSIGEAVARAHDLLAPEAGYDVRAIVVLTDGQENHDGYDRRYISDVSDLIGENVYAIGLGTPEVLNPAALLALCNGHEGYLYMTGALGTDAFFRVAKYYQQILAGISNEDIVSDPEGWIQPGAVHRIPYDVTEADIDSTIIALTPTPGLIALGLETPGGETISVADLPAYPTVSYRTGPSSAHYKVTYPVPTKAGDVAHAGRWHALLGYGRRVERGTRLIAREAIATNAFAHGARYSLTVHSYTNLRLRGRLDQSSREPGATVTVNATLTEYGLPVGTRADLTATVTRPDDSAMTVALRLDGDTWSASFPSPLAGVYIVSLQAAGRTLRGRPFTREQTLTAAVWAGGDRPPPRTEPGPPDGRRMLCELLGCLLRDKALVTRLEHLGVDVDRFEKCLRRVCRERRSDGVPASTVERMLANPDVLARLTAAIASELEAEDNS